MNPHCPDCFNALTKIDNNYGMGVYICNNCSIQYCLHPAYGLMTYNEPTNHICPGCQINLVDQHQEFTPWDDNLPTMKMYYCLGCGNRFIDTLNDGLVVVVPVERPQPKWNEHYKEMFRNGLRPPSQDQVTKSYKGYPEFVKEAISKHIVCDVIDNIEKEARKKRIQRDN